MSNFRRLARDVNTLLLQNGPAGAELYFGCGNAIVAAVTFQPEWGAVVTSYPSHGPAMERDTVALPDEMELFFAEVEAEHSRDERCTTGRFTRAVLAVAGEPVERYTLRALMTRLVSRRRRGPVPAM